MGQHLGKGRRFFPVKVFVHRPFLADFVCRFKFKRFQALRRRNTCVIDDGFPGKSSTGCLAMPTTFQPA
jgi:hypothetical protein